MVSQFELPDVVFRLVKLAKGIGKLAKICGIRTCQIYNRKRVPEHHLDTIYRVLGVHPMELRPDVFDPERIRKKAEYVANNKSRGPRRRRYKYKRAKLKPGEFSTDWLDDSPKIAYTQRGKRLAGIL